MIPIGVSFKPEKIHDVTKLLTKHYDNDWRALKILSWYIILIDSGVSKIPNTSNKDCKCFDLEEEIDGQNIVNIVVMAA